MGQIATAIFVCVVCRGSLRREAHSLVCESCGQTYRVIANEIPIFLTADRIPQRVPDPGISFDRAVALAEELAALPGTFADLVAAYYEALRDIINPSLFDYYRNIVVQRGVGESADEVNAASLALNVLGQPFPKVNLAVEIGCGWGFSLAALGKCYQGHSLLRNARLCGFDLNPAILVIAKRLFRELQLEDIEVAVADVQESLPLTPKSVDFLFASCVVEHLLAQGTSMGNFAEVLSAESVLYFSVPNRYMLHPEPHFNVRFVGCVPRGHQQKYVGWRLGIPAQEVETIFSYTPQDLATVLCPHFPQDLIVALPVYVGPTKRAKRVLAKLCKPLWVNYYHCIVHRTSAVAVANRYRGKLPLTSIVDRRAPHCVKVLDARGDKASFARLAQSHR